MSDRSCASCDVKLPVMRPSPAMPRLDRRRREHAVVEDDGELAADVRLREVAELAGTLLVEREADRRQVVLVERRARVTQVVAADRRHAAHDVVLRRRRAAARRGDIGRAGHDHAVRRQVVVDRLHRGFLARERALLDQLQLEDGRRADDVLRPLHVGHAGKLHHQLVGGALAGDDRLGHAKLVDAALDRLQGLRDRFLAQLVRDVRSHHVGISPGARLPVEDSVGFDRRLAERLVVLDALDHELRRAGGFETRHGHAGHAQCFAQAFDRRFRLEAQRIVSLDAQDEMDAAFQVEPEPALLLRRVEREDEQPEDAEDDEDFPAQILVHGAIYDS